MDISVTRFRANCLEIIRQVESGGGPVDIKRRGKVVARLAAPATKLDAQLKPWERLRGTGQLLATAGESALEEADFEAMR